MQSLPLKFFSTILVALTIACAYGQGQGQRIGGAVPDPDMLPGMPSTGTSLGNLYTVNLYDGTATVNVPIYKYTSGDADLGISFSYNTKGVMVSEIASDIGLHWNLNAGFSISRNLKDLPDEVNILNADTNIYQWSGLSFMRPQPGWPPAPYDTVSLNQFWAFKGKYVVYSESLTSATDTLIYRDKEADDFIVSLGGKSFTFNLGANGTVFTHPRVGGKVEVLWDGQPFTTVGDMQPIGQDYGVPNLLGFRITDEQGNRYSFIPGEFEMRQIEDVFGTSSMVANYNFTTRWVIDEIVLASGGKIKYNYYTFSGNGMVLPSYKNNTKREGVFPSDNQPDSFTVYPVIYNTCKIKEILYPNDVRVNFLYSSLIRQDGLIGSLREIRISTAQNCLRYLMKQSYFSSTGMPEQEYASGVTLQPVAAVNEGDRSKRLKLNGIYIASCDSSLVEPYYTFEYDPEMLPPRMDPRQDFFGYFNDGIFKSPNPGNIESDAPTLIPRHHKWIPSYPNYDIYSDSAYFMDRDPNSEKARACLLRKINNAYGGAATFYYSGNNNLTNPLESILPTDEYYFGKYANDGMRLDSVIEEERFHPGNNKVTVYTYSGGQRFMSGGYFHSPDRMYGTDVNNTFIRNIIFNGSYVTPHQMVNGSNHGYSNVEVITRTGQGTLLGRKVVRFSNLLDDIPGSLPKYFVVNGGKHFFIYPYSDKQYLLDWQMGLVLEVAEYNYNNRIVRNTINKYKFTIDTTSSMGLIENNKEGLVVMDGMGEVPGISHVAPRMKFVDSYRPYTGAALLDTVIVNDYISDSQFITDITHYEYDNRNNIREIVTQTGNGDWIRTVLGYNYTIGAATGTTLGNMTTAGLEKKIGTEKWLVSSSGIANDKLLNATFNTYTFQDNTLRQKYRYDLRLGQPITFSQYTGYVGGVLPPPFAQAGLAFAGGSIPNFKISSEVTSTDFKGNPIETKILDQEDFMTLIWDTTGRKIAEVNAPYGDVAYSSFEYGANANWNYNPAGAINITDPISGRNAYQYSYGVVSRSGLNPNKKYKVAFWTANLGVLPVCTVDGSSVMLIAGATKGNWTYYEGEVTISSSSSVVVINGQANGFIDELRLFPLNSIMRSWSYIDLFGQSATGSAIGRVTYYEYDKLGRHVITRDQEGNIISKTEIHIAQ